MTPLLPQATVGQLFILRLLAAGPMKGKAIRAELLGTFADKSLPSFSQAMARLVRSGWASVAYVRDGKGRIGGRERQWEVTREGRFQLHLGAQFGLWLAESEAEGGEA